MITSIKEYKTHLTQVTQDDITNSDKYLSKIINHDNTYNNNNMIHKNINKTINIALTFNLNKQQTIKLIQNVFTNPSQAPSMINVNFVKTYLDDILKSIDNLTENNFNIYNYTNEMLNITNNDIAMYVEGINDFVHEINEKINILNFNCIYENNILFISNFEKLNEHNKNTILNTIKKYNGINITNKLNMNVKINKL